MGFLFKMDIDNFDYIKVLKEVNDYPLDDIRKDLFFSNFVGAIIADMDIQTATFYAYNKIKGGKNG